MRLLFIISIIFSLFITTTTAPYFNIREVVTYSFLPITLFIIITLVGKPYVWKNKCNIMAYKIIIFGIFLLLIKYSIGQDYFKSILYFLFIPVLISIVFETIEYRKIRILKYILLSFFIIECILAIYERITQSHVFYLPIDNEYSSYTFLEEWAFRSSSLMGHPLVNAMVVTTILSFMLLSNSISIISKILLTALGYISIYCFNARGATIVVSIFLLPYLLYLISKTKNKKIRKISYLSFIIGGCIFLYYLFNSSLGGRLFNEEKVLDGSAQTRLYVFDFYKFLTPEQLLWGSPNSYTYVMNKLQAGGVENGVIVLIINYGLIPTLIILPLLMYFHYKKLVVYSKFERLWIMTIFYVVGVMNPNLSVPIVWIIWLYSYYAFRNKIIAKI